MEQLFVGINSPTVGQKVGQIVKVSRSGFLNKTWEAELIRGGFAGGGGVNGTSFHFTISSDAMAEEAERSMEKQTEVVIGYRAPIAFWRLSSESNGQFLTSIKASKP